MRKYIIRRVLYAIPTLLGISVIVFAISRLAPGDPVRLYTFAATNITEPAIAALAHVYGPDQTLPVRYVTGLVNLLHAHFGRARPCRQPASRLLAEVPPGPPPP